MLTKPQSLSFLFLLLHLAQLQLCCSKLETTSTPKNLKVAYLADTGVNDDANAVYEMVKDWGASFIVDSGDLGYGKAPQRWLKQMELAMGSDYPYLTAVGNHDSGKWCTDDGYAKLLQKQASSSGIQDYCEGELGLNMVCHYNGILIVITSMSIKPVEDFGVAQEHLTAIEEAFQKYGSRWKVCSFHKPQGLFQVSLADGATADLLDYAVYELCNQYGAIIVTGHNHVYARTYAMSSYVNQDIASEDTGNSVSTPIIIDEGRTFAVISGAGGEGMQEWDEDLVDNDWWVTVYAKDNGLVAGALMCTYNYEGDADMMFCKFQQIDGIVRDSFYVKSQVSENIPVSVEAKYTRVIEHHCALTSSADIPKTCSTVVVSFVVFVLCNVQYMID